MKFKGTEIFRYVINGLVATVVHYGVLVVNLNVIGFKSAGLANFFAAIVGITTSFLGNRYFVFNHKKVSIAQQALTFSSLYGAIAVLHGFFIWLWTDWQGLDFRIGFFLATFVQVLISYLGNKFFIFRA